MKTNKRKSREMALQSLYSIVSHGGYSDNNENLILTYQKIIRDLKIDSEELKEYAYKLVETVRIQDTKINNLLVKHSENWSLERINIIDLTVLKIALVELLYFSEIPPKVIITEAVQIAKKYSTYKSSTFINGVLDNIYKSQNLSV